MARPINYWLDLRDEDTNNVFENQAAVSGNQTLDGAGAVTLPGGSAIWYAQDTALSRIAPNLGVQSDTLGLSPAFINTGGRHWGRRLSIDVDDTSTITFTVTGYNENGFYVTEAIQANGTTLVEGAEYFTEVTTVAGDGVDASNHFFGIIDELRSPIFATSWYYDVGTRVVINVTGTINYTVQETFDPILDPVFWQKEHKREPTALASVPHWIDLQAAGTADSNNAASVGATGLRVNVSSYSSGAEIDVHIIPEAN